MRSTWNRLNLLGKALVVLVLFAALYFIGSAFGADDKIDALIANKAAEGEITYTDATWIGFIGGHAAEFPMPVNAEFIKDYPVAVEAWLAGEINVIWSTADTAPISGQPFFDNDPVIFFATDYSRGGDKIVGQPYIETLNDLCNGRRVAYAEFSPHHSLLLVALEAAGCTIDDVESVTVASYEDEIDAYLSGDVDAAVLASPFDLIAAQERSGTQVLFSTESTPYLIPNIWIVSREYYEANLDELTDFVEAWLLTNATLNTSGAARQAAYPAFASHLNLNEEEIEASFPDTRLMTIGDNADFFGMNPAYRGLTGKDVYDQMASLYREAGILQDRAPRWDDLVDLRVIEAVRGRLTGSEHAAADPPDYEPLTASEEREIQDTQELASRAAQINFATGSAVLSDEAKFTIDRDFVPTAQSFETRIRIEGHTDPTGSPATNRTLSQQRAQSVADYLTTKGISNTRLVVVGRGSDQPVCRETTPACYADNRRTEFELIQ